MSESPEARTKRKIISAMKNYQPLQLTSFYFDEDDDPELVLKAFPIIRRKISAGFIGITLIWWLRVTRFNRQVVPMFQVFSTDILDKKILKKIIDRIDVVVNLRFKQFNRTKVEIDKWCTTIANQKLHNLSNVYSKEKIRRFAITNKSLNK
ncbi:hypothetical protein Sbal625DRAFT_3960 [Shewanella baltica OS625]|uniref:Uncharacterized protein n=1 Tax=Shewanella baltica (strain OS195) TaxID=399599 RepID=A9KUU1_SHEB9|nr:hypothetical protein [Shewanella baltica]ABX49351.1 conserved hypothetical protein [Shewanella baltica OS195]ABX50109.1 conserved hypothetical protein [Shewanella baltica OS195]ADT95102.1 hypothetical protein Sbal678_2953 [Shewanella baltica OS678]EHC04371.1 hypothetical protein Sbal625DRAFT_3960 [Shewanella baltica OS625]